MKTTILILLATLALHARAGLVTLTANTNETVELSIGTYETAELVSYPTTMNSFGASLMILKDGKTITYRYGSWPAAQSSIDTLVVAGPATIRFAVSAGPNSRPGLCTFRVSPEAYPPDRSIIVPPGTNQVQLTLECSTNLVRWVSATNGVYGPSPEAKFFRIKMERLQ
jgi:hypothetical protein